MINILKRIFNHTSSADHQSGRMMIELLLALALAAAMLPFLFRQEQSRIERAESIRIAEDIALVRSALERFMDINQERLFSATMGRHITRVTLAELENYGLDIGRIRHVGEYQLRIVKAADRMGRSVLQGIIVIDMPYITPMRTREIANVAGGQMGFADGRRTFGAFGTWDAPGHTWAATFTENSIVDITQTIRSGGQFLRRVISDSTADATMQSLLHMGGHGILNVRGVFTESINILETLHVAAMNVNRLVVDSNITLDGNINIGGEVNVQGALTSESRNIDAGVITVPGASRFGTVRAGTLWTGDLYIPSFSVPWDGDQMTIMTIGRTLDMTGGRVTVNSMAVGFGGSVTPRLVVRDMITDPVADEYYWDVRTGAATMSDIRIPDLPLMMRAAMGRDTTSDAARAMIVPANNSNATVADFARALAEVERIIRQKKESLGIGD